MTDARGDRKQYRIVKRNRSLYKTLHQNLMMKVHACRRELFVGDCTRKVTGEKRFRKLLLYVKLTDNAEFYGAEGKDIGDLNSGRKLFSRTKHR